MDRHLLEARIVFADGEKVARVLRSGGFAIESDDVIGNTCREVTWRFGKSARGRKAILELLECAIGEAGRINGHSATHPVRAHRRDASTTEESRTA